MSTDATTDAIADVRHHKKKARQAQWATLLLLSLLIALLTAETVLLVPPRLQPLIIGIKVLPLVVFFWPITRARAMSTVWLGFLLMLYFCWAVLGFYQPGLAGKLAMMRAVVITACFTSAMLFTRWQRAVLEA
jgi:uncharacterized membrane protein